jgi:hypothetical protein
MPGSKFLMLRWRCTRTSVESPAVDLPSGAGLLRIFARLRTRRA